MKTVPPTPESVTDAQLNAIRANFGPRGERGVSIVTQNPENGALLYTCNGKQAWINRDGDVAPTANWKPPA